MPDPRISPFHLSRLTDHSSSTVLRHFKYINQNLYASSMMFRKNIIFYVKWLAWGTQKPHKIQDIGKYYLWIYSAMSCQHLPLWTIASTDDKNFIRQHCCVKHGSWLMHACCRTAQQEEAQLCAHVAKCLLHIYHHRPITTDQAGWQKLSQE